jgi:hypothetical protein
MYCLHPIVCHDIWYCCFPIYVSSTAGIWCLLFVFCSFFIRFSPDFPNVMSWLSYLCFGYYAHMMLLIVIGSFVCVIPHFLNVMSWLSYFSLYPCLFLIMGTLYCVGLVHSFIVDQSSLVCERHILSVCF